MKQASLNNETLSLNYTSACSLGELLGTLVPALQLETAIKPGRWCYPDSFANSFMLGAPGLRLPAGVSLSGTRHPGPASTQRHQSALAIGDVSGTIFLCF